jgi:hypothetical protein
MRITLKAKMPEARPVALGDGLVVLAPVKVVVTGEEGDDLPYDLQIEVSAEGGHLVPKSVTATTRPGGPPLNGTGLRQLPIARVLFMGFEDSVMRATGKRGGAVTLSPVNYGDELEATAAWYRLAMAVGIPPVQAVARRFNISATTARGRVARARSKDLLGPTEKGRASI